MNKLLFSLLSFLSASLLYSQTYNAERYREKIFTTSTAQIDVKYGEAPQWVFPYWDEDLYVDIYTPTGDINTKRPLIILAHAGGFLNGDKDVDDMVALCDSFARKGYVTATIAYRKGFNPLDSESAERAVYRGIQDGKAAVRYFKNYASTYGIDTNNVFFGGMSAGGYVAMHVGYMDKESERPVSTYGGGTVNDLGCLDCAGNNYPVSSSVKAILDYWGAVQDTSIIEAGDIPIMIMHGENDPTVPFVYGHAFSLPTLPQTYGGQPISERVQNLGIDYEIYTSQGSLHMLDGSNNGTFDNPPNSFWSDTLLPRTQDFLIDLIEPKPTKITQDITYICNGESINIEVDGDLSSHYIWGYNNNVTTIANTNTEVVSLEFNTSGNYDIYALEFNEILCASDTLWFHVVVYPEIAPDFNSTVNDIVNYTFTNTSNTGNSFAWDFGDGNTSTDENPQHTYLADGIYNVSLLVTDQNGCQDSISKTITILGLSAAEFNKSDFNIYPNPAYDYVTIQTNSTEPTFISIKDATGKIVYQSETSQTNQTIATQDWANGLYIVTISSESGIRSQQKLVHF